MIHIKRNNTHRSKDIDLVYRAIRRRKEVIKESFKENIFIEDTDRIGLNTRSFLDLLWRLSVLEGDNHREEQIYFLSLIKRFAKAHYTLAYNPEEMVEISLEEGKTHQVKAPKGLKLLVDFNSWLRYLSIFIVLRDREGFDLMLKAKEEYFKLSNAHYDKLDHILIQFFKAIENPTQALTIKAFEATKPFVGNYLDEKFAAEFVLNQFEPLLCVYDALFRKDDDLFNKELEKALRLHQEYYTDESDDTDHSADASKGWVSWLLLAPVTMAYDRGVKINVSSEYIPEWLYKKEFDI
ncbi:immunity 49 family protein [Flammeovirga kamogawensis]|uniref:Immunity 49 family protein n=1 Tax=Flammeovirga kamogawensis TaxID=373891 RepID=A0ABX8H3E4_9BACT|nr:immunity 49 family protein [Flammeovirga kamogawensis]MBB6460271.1 hypothetical protein [Flammeovirga kamogawensis]QWG10082.1 immunity 49 family protein [Flammeovirga kamogawensis]TRX65589.1 hypothetical protein EO216_24015 [Flammeovirga kamogawensis]